jgi:hypothetical protein
VPSAQAIGIVIPPSAKVIPLGAPNSNSASYILFLFLFLFLFLVLLNSLHSPLSTNHPFE